MLVNSSSGAKGMWDLLTYFRPQSSFSFYVHVVLSQSVRYKFESLKTVFDYYTLLTISLLGM